VQLGLPFIGEWRGAPSYRRVHMGPCIGPGNRWYTVPGLLYFIQESIVPGDIPYVFSICGVPSVGPTGLLARG
jgi:hypothetical protein